jgi:ferritin-like metal-binding protein YciE
MAARRRKTSSGGKKSTAASKKRTTTSRSGGGTKRSTSAKKTTSRKTSGTRKKTTSGAKKKTSGSRSRSKSASSRSGSKSSTRKSSSSRKASGSRKSSSRTASKRTSSRASARTAPARRQLELRSLDDVLRDQIADLRSAEQQLVAALPKVARAASSQELRQAFEHHLEETRGHVQRLDQIIGDLGGVQPERCEGMEGLILEGEQIVEASGDNAAKDAALIAAAQRIEHYEIAAYGTAKALAGELGLSEARDLLNDTLSEESNADQLLTRIATGGFFGSGVNEDAAE